MSQHQEIREVIDIPEERLPEIPEHLPKLSELKDQLLRKQATAHQSKDYQLVKHFHQLQKQYQEMHRAFKAGPEGLMQWAADSFKNLDVQDAMAFKARVSTLDAMDGFGMPGGLFQDAPASQIPGRRYPRRTTKNRYSREAADALIKGPGRPARKGRRK
eukprot:gnl/Dysnectes_brevis/2889_a3529_1564.p1 GENE.gnl/Dysnectes_brevis/2889_a3529_1564~~gnl/Dysnectes_brevis/2889_a3529_1564.p1  ORF type:complete len:172 (-),score=8.01 gnl/Dysnectes_brevis/2889_a3529_1564:36-512(-)